MSKPILFSVIFFLMLGLHFNSYASESISTSSTSNDHPIAIGFNCDTLVKKVDVDSLKQIEALNKVYKKYRSLIYGVSLIELALIGASVVDVSLDSYGTLIAPFAILGGLLLLIPIVASDRFENKVEDSKLAKETRKKLRWRGNRLLLLFAFFLLIVAVLAGICAILLFGV